MVNGPQDLMAGNDYWNRITATGVFYGPWAGAQLCCDVSVSPSFPIGNFLDFLTNVLLERRTGWYESRVEGSGSIGKIGVKLMDGFCQEGRWRVL